MGFLNKDSLPRLVEKLSDGSNIKINNKYGNRVNTVIDKLADKAKDVTKTIEQEVVNTAHTFKIGTGNIDVSSDVEDGFGEVGLKGNTYQNLIQNDNNDSVIPNQILTTKKDTVQTFKVNDGEINLNIDGKTYQNLFSYFSYNRKDFNIQEINNGEFLSSITNSPLTLADSDICIKPNTEYTCILKTKSTNELSVTGAGTWIRIENAEKQLGGVTGLITTEYKEFRFRFITNNSNYIRIVLRNTINIEGNTLYVKDIVILEGDHIATELPTSINGIESVAERESKNLLDGIKWHDGMINNDNGQHLDSDVAMYSDLIDIDINTLYYTNLIDNNGNTYRCRLYKADGSYLGRGLTATSTKDMYDRRANLKGLAKIRLLILNKTVTPLPSNPVLLPNLYTEGDVNVKGTNSYMCVKKQINVKPNTTYVARVNIESINKGDNNYTPRLQIKKGSTFICETMSSTTFNSGDNTTLDVAMYVNNAYASTTECEANFKNISITEANLYPVKLTNKSKNLLNISTFKPISYSSIQTSKNGNVITVKGLKTADVEAYTDAKAGNIKVYLEEDKTYSASFKSDGNFGVRNGEDTVEIFFMLDGTTKHYFNVAGQRTVTIPKGYGGYYYLRLDVNSGDKTHKFWDIQIEEGNIVTDYEPYYSEEYNINLPIPLRALPNGICDSIENNKLIQKVEKFVIDGSHSISSGLHERTNTVRISFGIKCKPNSNESKVVAISDLLPYKYIYNTDEIGFFVSNSGDIYLSLEKTKFNSITSDGIKSYLRSNPITLYCELATPIEHELNIPQMFEKYSTNIITTSNNIKPNFNIESKGYEYKALIKPSTQYTLMLNAKDGSDNLDFVLGGTKITVPKTNSRNLIQTPNTLTDSSLYIGGLDTTVNNIMLLEGNLTQDENVPSYFEGIVGVGDKSKNLFNADSSIRANGNVTYLSHKNKIEVDYVGGFELFLNDLEPINLKKGTYTLSFESKTISGDGIALKVTKFNNRGLLIKQSSNSFQFTLAEDTEICIVCVRTGEQGRSELYNLQLEEGSVATEHQPYGKHKIEILSCGKNLVDTSKLPQTNTDKCFVDAYLKKGSTYCMSAISDIFGGYIDIRSSELDSSIVQIVSDWGANVTKFTFVGESGNYKIFLWKSRLPYVYHSKLQLEESSTPTIHEPYQEDKTQILLDEPLMRLPNGVCDEITRDGKLIRRVGKSVLTGVEDWTHYTTAPTSDINMLFSCKLGITANSSRNLYCNNFLDKDAWNNVSSEGIQVGRANLSGYDIRINKSRLLTQDIEGFKQWLSENPTTVYYELAEPVITEIPVSYVRYFKDGHLTFNTLVAPESTHLVQLNKSAQIERSIREVQSLDGRVEKLESFYDDMILENNHKLQLLDMDFNYARNMEDI